jgi:hypothetical protein
MKTRRKIFSIVEKSRKDDNGVLVNIYFIAIHFIPFPRDFFLYFLLVSRGRHRQLILGGRQELESSSWPALERVQLRTVLSRFDRTSSRELARDKNRTGAIRNGEDTHR